MREPDWATADGSARIYVGDCLDSLRQMESESIQCCVTSPPYWGLRDYGHDGQMGLEKTPEEYVAKMVDVFREVRRVLRDDGTLWLNLGDSYNNTDKWGGGGGNTGKQTIAWTHGDAGCTHDPIDDEDSGFSSQCVRCRKCGGSGVVESWAVRRRRDAINGLKPKDLVGIPWRVAFALQADGWYLRQDIIWHKPNPMPESVTDRCTKSHEYIFLLAKSARYYYDADAICEPCKPSTVARVSQPTLEQQAGSDRVPGKTNGPMKAVFGGRNKAAGYGTRIHSGNEDDGAYLQRGANKRSVWSVTTKPYKQAHFATFPPDLIEPCILAGCPEGGVVLDPFNGSGTTGAVCIKHGRRYVGLELNPTYVELAKDRIGQAVRECATPLFEAKPLYKTKPLFS